MVGRVEAGEASGRRHLPFAGATAVLAHCADARPCAVELWRDDQGHTLTLLRAGRTLRPVIDDRVVTPPKGSRRHAATGRWRTHWQTLGSVLPACIEDPLAVPPAGDAAGFRLLQASPEDLAAGRWALHFSGANRCALSGMLLLDATRDHADANALTVDGLPWKRGGRERALARLNALVGAPSP